MQVNASVIFASCIHWWWIQRRCSVCNQKHLKLIQDARLDGRRRKWPRGDVWCFFSKMDLLIELVINTYFDSNFEPKHLTSNIPTPPPKKRVLGVGMFCWHLMAFGAANLGGQCRWMHKMAAPTRVQMREALLPRQAEMARDDHGREYLSRISPPKKRWEDDLKPPLWWDMFDMLVGTVFVLHVRNDKQTKNDTLGELSQSCEFFPGSPQKDQKSSGKMPILSHTRLLYFGKADFQRGGVRFREGSSPIPLSKDFWTGSSDVLTYFSHG